MRMLKYSFLLCSALLIMAGSAAAQKIDTDFDHHADFSQYHTYAWLREPMMKDQLAKQRVMDDVNRQLQAKGWQLVNGNADVGVVANVATQNQQTLNTFYDGFPGWRWNWAGGDTTTTVETYTVGTLVVDLFDEHTKQAIFRATATDTLSDKQEKNDAKIDKAVEQMFAKFPPRSS